MNPEAITAMLFSSLLVGRSPEQLNDEHLAMYAQFAVRGEKALMAAMLADEPSKPAGSTPTR